MTPGLARILAALLLVAVLVVALCQHAPARQTAIALAPMATPSIQPFTSITTATPIPVTGARSRTSPCRRSGCATPSARRGGVTATPAPSASIASATPADATPVATLTEVTADAAPSHAPLSLPALDDLLAAVPAHVGMEIEAADGTPLLQHNADSVFEAASLYKLAIMVEVYRQREAGLLQFSDTLTLWPGYFVEGDPVYGEIDSDVPIGELLRNMIVVSSNVAAEALLDRVGTDNVNATMAQLGLNQTEIRWYPDKGTGSDPSPFDFSTLPSGDSVEETDALNITSPQDMARLYLLLLQGQVVSPAASAEMLDLLSQQEINDRLPADLPGGTQVAHKTGNLDDVVHDAGVIYAPRGPIIVAILTDQVGDEGQVDDFMSQVAKAVYDAGS